MEESFGLGLCLAMVVILLSWRCGDVLLTVSFQRRYELCRRDPL